MLKYLKTPVHFGAIGAIVFAFLFSPLVLDWAIPLVIIPLSILWHFLGYGTVSHMVYRLLGGDFTAGQYLDSSHLLIGRWIVFLFYVFVGGLLGCIIGAYTLILMVNGSLHDKTDLK